MSYHPHGGTNEDEDEDNSDGTAHGIELHSPNQQQGEAHTPYGHTMIHTSTATATATSTSTSTSYQLSLPPLLRSGDDDLEGERRIDEGSGLHQQTSQIPQQGHHPPVSASHSALLHIPDLTNNAQKKPKRRQRRSRHRSKGRSGPKKGNRQYKTELCRTWLETQTCRYGDKCQFAHGDDEVRQVSRHPKYKTLRCATFHTTGNCRYGVRCHFIHDMSDPERRAIARARQDVVDMQQQQHHQHHFQHQHHFPAVDGLPQFPPSYDQHATEYVPLQSSPPPTHRHQSHPASIQESARTARQQYYDHLRNERLLVDGLASSLSRIGLRGEGRMEQRDGRPGLQGMPIVAAQYFASEHGREPRDLDTPLHRHQRDSLYIQDARQPLTQPTIVDAPYSSGARHPSSQDPLPAHSMRQQTVHIGNRPLHVPSIRPETQVNRADLSFHDHSVALLHAPRTRSTPAPWTQHHGYDQHEARSQGRPLSSDVMYDPPGRQHTHPARNPVRAASDAQVIGASRPHYSPHYTRHDHSQQRSYPHPREQQAEPQHAYAFSAEQHRHHHQQQRQHHQQQRQQQQQQQQQQQPFDEQPLLQDLYLYQSSPYDPNAANDHH